MDTVEIKLPSAFAEQTHWMQWPEEVYAGRMLRGMEEKISVEALPITHLPKRAEK